MTLSTLGQIALTVKNVDSATAFYRDQLGLPFLFAAPPGLAFFSLGSTRLMLAEPEDGQAASGNSVLYFNVDDIHAAYDDLRGRGVPFDEAPHLVARMGATELWMAFFRDPDQNLMGIMCEIPVKETAG